jgi:hypothetical protein
MELLPVASHTVPGDVEAIPAGETAPKYVRIHKKERNNGEGNGEKQDNWGSQRFKEWIVSF